MSLATSSSSIILLSIENNSSTGDIIFGISVDGVINHYWARMHFDQIIHLERSEQLANLVDLIETSERKVSKLLHSIASKSFADADRILPISLSHGSINSF